MHFREGVQRESVRHGCSAAEASPPSDERTLLASAHWQFCSAAALPEESFAAPSGTGSSGLPAAAVTEADTAAIVDVEAAADDTAAAENAVAEIANHRPA